MKKNFLQQMMFGAAFLLAAGSCSQDELAGDGTQLPEGKYPLQIASVTLDAEVGEQPWGASHAPQTRVAENPDGNSSAWEWNGTERIGVQLYTDGDVATYILNANNTLSPDKTLYWRNTQSTTVTAWYPAYTGDKGTVSLADQSSGLAYVLKGSGEGDHNSPVTLNFTHALAKVRVVPSGSDKGKALNVKINTFTSCTHTQGTISTTNSSKGWITMMPVKDGDVIKYWEANVVPTETITELEVNGNIVALDNGGVTPEAAKINIIKLTVGKEIYDLSDYEGQTLTISGKAIIKGNKDTPKNVKIELKDGADVTLSDVNIALGSYGNAITSNGDVALTIEGENKLQGKAKVDRYGGGAGILVNTGTLKIKGSGNLTANGDGYRENAFGSGPTAGIGVGKNANVEIELNGGTLTAQGGPAGPGIGGCVKDGQGTVTIVAGTIIATGGSFAAGIGGGIYQYCGNILIKGGNVTATGGENGTGIGTGGEYSSCGDITITGGTIVATPGIKAAGIGTGGTNLSTDFTLVCGNISIGQANVTAKKGTGASALIGKGYSGSQCGKVSIKTGAVINNTTYTADSEGELK